ncbi:MAG: hypothetical protein QW818_02465 [Candidatus Aenigmatarchaeota archaeon]
MADYNSSLPVRSQADADERVQVKVVDASTPTQGQSVDSTGHASTKTDGVYNAVSNPDPSSSGLIAHQRQATPDDTHLTQRLTSVTNGNKRLLDVSIHDEDGAAFSDANPLPVYMAQDPGTEVHNYNTEASVAVNATSNHDYPVTTGTFELHQVIATASGKMRVAIQRTIDGITYTTLAVGFNSTANPNIVFTFARPHELPGGSSAAIRVVRLNRDNQAQDVYSTIVGVLK